VSRYNIFVEPISRSSRCADTRLTATPSCSYCCMVLPLLPWWSLGRLDHFTAVCCPAQRSHYTTSS